MIDTTTITGTGEGGKITSGDILHAARVMEMEQSVARIETAHEPAPARGPEQPDWAEPQLDTEDDDAPNPALEPMPTTEDEVGEHSDTSTSVAVGGEPIAVPPSPWEDYNGSTEGLSDIARPGAEQSWGEAEAHLAAMAEEAASSHEEEAVSAPLIDVAPGGDERQLVPAVPEHAPAASAEQPQQQDDAFEPLAVPERSQVEPEQHREVMMDFGTLELVDPESVWAEGAEDFAPWFLAHSQQLGDVLGLKAGLADARQFTTKSATGVLGRDDSGDDVVVVSSKNATADDSDLGHALGMAASSGAASVALVSAAFGEDQLKALAWLNNQTRSGVKWYGIEMRVVRIAESPAAMLFDLVAAPPA